MTQISDFSKNVLKCIQQIPAGNVATYGQIAKLAGKPQGARGVAWLLHSCSDNHKLPWHRVLNAKGQISFPVGSSHFKQQKKKLQSEGIEISPEGQLSLTKFQWKKKVAKKKTPAQQPRMFGS